MAIKMDGNVITELELHASDGTTETKQLTEELNLQQKTATVNGDVTPDAGYDGLSKVVVSVEGGGELPTLTDPATAADILNGKEAIDGNGAKLTGICTFDADTSDADAVASDIAQGKTAYVNGNKVVGTHEEAAGGLVPFDTYTFTIAEDYTDVNLPSIATIETFDFHQIMFDTVKKGSGYNNSPTSVSERTRLLATINGPDVGAGDYNRTTQVLDVYQNNENKIVPSSSVNTWSIYGTVVCGQSESTFADEGQSSGNKLGLWLKGKDGLSFLVRGRATSYNAILEGVYTINFYDITSVV